ncbi:MAG: MgtC/SapB family protein [Muribaculaceae bacterium]|nr:MgtC/SapB family protein [Bacteroides sp.]MDE7496174.1 MgtC/SapB family protein [Muribaculaceae bacterium]
MQDLWNILVDDLCSLEVDPFNSLFRMLLSMVLGAAVGTERKRKGQIAGVRTFALISMGACLAMILSIYVPQEYLGLKNGDPGRIAAQVITGIGFIGGGAIIQMKGSVRGLTTAAGIWSTAIIGMACGIGMYGVAIGSTIMIFVVLVVFEAYERWRGIGQEAKVINVTVNGIVQDLARYKEVFNSFNTHLSTYYIDYNYVENRTEISFLILVNPHGDLLPLLRGVREAGDTRSIVLSSQLDI